MADRPVPGPGEVNRVRIRVRCSCAPTVHVMELHPADVEGMTGIQCECGRTMEQLPGPPLPWERVHVIDHYEDDAGNWVAPPA